MDYEAKWHPAIKDEDNKILQTEYRMAKHLRDVLNLDQPERTSEKALEKVMRCSEHSNERE